MIKSLRAMSPLFETPLFYYKPYPGSALAASVTGEVPRSLEDWARFDYVGGAAGNWVPPDLYQRIERFKFYNRHAVGPTRGLASTLLRRLSRWRIDNDVYALPLEKALVTRLRHEQALS
jgi:hypothetical protein